MTENPQGEIWKPYPPNPRFTVSNLGRVRGRRGNLLKFQVCAGGHLNFVYRDTENGKARAVLVHQAVLLAFVGPRPNGCGCRHLNGVPNDNRLVNLVWGTHRENMTDRCFHNRLRAGKKLSLVNGSDPRSTKNQRWRGVEHPCSKAFLDLKVRALPGLTLEETLGRISEPLSI